MKTIITTSDSNGGDSDLTAKEGQTAAGVPHWATGHNCGQNNHLHPNLRTCLSVTIFFYVDTLYLLVSFLQSSGNFDTILPKAFFLFP